MKTSNLLTKKEVRDVLGGDVLRKLRNDVCYSQEYMAKKLGLSQSTYQRLESGEIKISEERLLKIAAILDKPIESVININQQSIEGQLTLLHTIIAKQQSLIEELKSLLALKG